MQRFRNILVSVAGDEAEPGVLARAIGLARRTGAALRLIDVVEDLPWYARLLLPNFEELRAAVVRQKTARLEALAAPIRTEGSAVATALLQGRPALETVREVLRGGHDLVLKDAEPSARGAIVPADMHLLRTCPCPVWLVRPAQPSRLFARVLAALDPTPESADPIGAIHRTALNAKILDLALSFAEWDGAELHVVHAWEAPGESLLRSWGAMERARIDAYIAGARDAARRALDALLAPHLDRIGKEHVHLIRGSAGEAIPQFAEREHVDLIIMGTVARTGIAGLLIGNTAETILQRVRCSVLAVKPDDFVSPVTVGAECGAPASGGDPAMKALRTVLLATDFRPASEAAAQAVGRLVAVFGSSVSLLHVLEPMPSWPVALHVLHERAQGTLHDLKQDLAGRGVTVEEALIAVGPVGDSIVDKARSVRADLVVIGAGERSRFDRFSVGPVAEAVLEHATTPVLAVRPGEPAVAFRTILCPVDWSGAARRGLENAIRLARAFGGRLIVLTVVPEAGWLEAVAGTGTLVGASEAFDRAWRAEFEELLAGLDFGEVPWEREVRTGVVHEAINAAAREHGADLIVMGATGRSGLARVLLGSVTRRMLRDLPCALLTVKDEDLMDGRFEEDLDLIRRLTEEGQALLAEGSSEEALARFRQALARHPYHADALEGQAAAYEQLGYVEEAGRCRRRAEAIRGTT
jgi:universal stress protein E